MPERPRALSTPELVGLVAALSALNALSVDIMLPALPDIGAEYALARDNDRQLVVVVYLAAFGVCQLLYGPLADAFGRRRVLLGALGLFTAGSVLCVLAPSFELLLAARAAQGVGAAATRVIAVAVVRDTVSGRRMAQIMSMAMTVFMIVPIIAPGLGQLILFVAPWRWIFAALLIYALAVQAWALLRLPETLTAENTTPFRPRAIASAFAAIFAERQTLGYMSASALILGALFGYIISAEQIYVEHFGLGAAFALAFAAVAIAMLIGTLINARIVLRYGMRRIAHSAAIAFTLLAFMLALAALTGLASFWVFMALLSLAVSLFGLIASNFNALAMEPVGRVAGTASALYGAVTTTAGAVIGGLIARAFDGTPAPFAFGMALAGAGAIACVLWAERGRLFNV